MRIVRGRLPPDPIPHRPAVDRPRVPPKSPPRLDRRGAPLQTPHMISPAARVRDLLARHHRAKTAHLVAELTGDDEELDTLARDRRTLRREIGRGELKRDLEEARSLGVLDAVEHASLVAHLASVAEDELRARERAPSLPLLDEKIDAALAEKIDTRAVRTEDARSPTLEELAMASPLEPTFFAPLRGRVDATLAADRAARDLSRAIHARATVAVDHPRDTFVDDAARFLAETEDALAESMARARHALEVVEKTRELSRLVELLRARPLAKLFDRERRVQRITARLRGVALSRALSGVKLRVHRALTPTALVWPVAGDRVELLASDLELGVASELALTVGIGTAMGLRGGAAALPFEHRVPMRWSLARGAGHLLARTLTNEPALMRELDGRRTEVAVRAVASLAVLLATRASLAAGRALVEGRTLDRDARDELTRSALGVDPRGIELPLWFARPDAVVDEARAALGAFALEAAAIRRFDEDFPRNPRFYEWILASVARGGRASVEDWMADASVDLSSAIARSNGRL